VLLSTYGDFRKNNLASYNVTTTCVLFSTQNQKKKKKKESFCIICGLPFFILFFGRPGREYLPPSQKIKIKNPAFLWRPTTTTTIIIVVQEGACSARKLRFLRPQVKGGGVGCRGWGLLVGEGKNK
jgi:hypothetical protein